MPRVFSVRAGTPPVGAVYVGRPSPWGNPFVVGRDGSRGECVARYRAFVMDPRRALFRERIRRELKGKDLVCWCAPLPCHADVLLEIANTTEGE